ncbi:MAG: histidine triad nucleotide-binding protein [Candidatus Omnitrophica bacterium]|nr:histidine triad nucleotide-binding protein [Candidatus Omnitrophota bacterium]
MSPGCVFCAIIEGQEPAKKLYEDKEVVAFFDINPQAPIHILVIPRRHIKNLLDVNEKDAPILSKLIMVATMLAKKHDIAETGYRIVVNTNRNAGQSVDHLHIHILGGRILGWPPG